MRDYNFGNFLRELREKSGLSQTQLGMLVGVSNKAVSKWENGSARPQSKILYKLSDVLGVTTDELLSCKYRLKEDENDRGVFAMKKDLWKSTEKKLHEKYGDIVPLEVLNRYLSEFAELKENDLIIFFHLLSLLQALKKEHNEYFRINGVISSSFAAFISGATELNPLKPHYFCPRCKKIEFDETVACGWDLPEKQCNCGEAYLRDGHNLPFEPIRILAKRASLDLVISQGFYSTVKKAISSYFDKNTLVSLVRQDRFDAETLIIIDKSTPFKCGDTLPHEEYYDRLRDYPAITLIINKEFDAFRSMQEETKTKPESIDFTDQSILKAFSSNNTDGVFEFKHNFVKSITDKVRPTSFIDLIQIPGFSHGTNVWLDNAEALIETVPAHRLIAYRDDVFNYIQAKMNAKSMSDTGFAYKIMEDTRRGFFAAREMTEEIKKQLEALDVDDWFIPSIKKMYYVFPKAHGVLCLKYALILMWYKLNHPEAFKKYFS